MPDATDHTIPEEPKTVIYFDEACFVPNLFSLRSTLQSPFTEISHLNTQTRILSSDLYRDGRQVGFAISTNWPISEDDQ